MTVYKLPSCSHMQSHFSSPLTCPCPRGTRRPHGGTLQGRPTKTNDGSLTRDEAKAMPRVLKKFGVIDTDKNGTVSLTEIQAAAKKMGKEAHKRGAERFKAADKNGDGMLDREEAKSMPKVAKNFDAIDADKNGTVTAKEIHNYMKTHHQERKKS